MTERGRKSTTGAVCALVALGCGPLDDLVFVPLVIEADASRRVSEGAGVVEVPLRLSAVQDRTVRASFRALRDEAQNDCPVPDFEAAEGSVEWQPGEREALVRIWIGEDDLAETDERFVLEVTPAQGFSAPRPIRLDIVIADNDRTALLDAAVRPGSSRDVAPELQRALDEAASFGRGVVVLAPGDYELSSVRVPSGVTLSGRGARLLRPPASAPEVVSIRLEHVGAEDSEQTLVEGLAIDGRRESQGPYRDKERQEAHLVALEGDAERGGRIRGTLEGLALASGTGSGLWVGPDADVTACRIGASELWRDAMTVRGGRTSVRLRGLDATATEGTGLWLGPRELGFEDSLVISVELEDVLIGAGDVEIESTAGSVVTVRGLTMTRPPFRLDALDGVVRIADSVLMLGLPSDTHDHFGPPHDVEISGTTLVASEIPNEADTPEAARTFAAVTVRGESLSPSLRPDAPGRLVFDGCRFEIGAGVESDDVVFAVESELSELDVSVRATTLGSGYADWFSPSCSGCTLEP